MNTESFHYGKDHLTAGKALQIARGELKGVCQGEARDKVKRCFDIVQAIVDKGDPVYGINTGFGPLCTTQIDKEETRKLQTNILQSHSVGVGDSIDNEIAKLMLVLKAHALSLGHSGVALETIDRIIWHIDNDVVPVVPSQGSVGASGDLAPLSHLFLPLIGMGKVQHKGEVKPTAAVLSEMGLEPINLGPKEGLALINGTQFIAAHAVKVVEKLHACLAQADIAGALMIEGLQGSTRPFQPELHALRPYDGNKHVAARLYGMLKNSEVMADHAHCDKVQDPYSLRCMPQVHGASRTAWKHLKDLLEIELNSVTDNPVVINEELTISGGNFHGQPMAMAIDYACLAAAEIGNISDRRIYLSLEGNYQNVPKLLMDKTGINSGYMILQYTSAALASENKGLCFPSSADSIPTSLGQEDHVSMGSIGGRKALQVVGNVEKILAIELLSAAQALDFQRPLRSSSVLEAVYGEIRKVVSFAEEDRIFGDDIEKGIDLVKGGSLLDIVGSQITTDYDSQFEAY